jgi:hypothetical protein
VYLAEKRREERKRRGRGEREEEVSEKEKKKEGRRDVKCDDTLKIARMLRLGLADNAKSIFLESRSKKIRSEIRKLKFEGDILENDLPYLPPFFPNILLLQAVVYYSLFYFLLYFFFPFPFPSPLFIELLTKVSHHF